MSGRPGRARPRGEASGLWVGALLCALACRPAKRDGEPDAPIERALPEAGGGAGEGAGDDSGDDGGDGDSASPDDTDAPPCSGTRPTLAPVVPDTDYILSGGEIGEDGTMEPIVEVLSFSLPILASDPDGDLHTRTLRFWMEPADDGLIDPDLLTDLDVLFDGERCAVTSTADGLAWVGMSGTFPLPFDTAYDVGVQVLDALGLPSEPWMGTVYTPRADGTPGGPPEAAAEGG